jgi:hypothetical protein
LQTALDPLPGLASSPKNILTTERRFLGISGDNLVAKHVENVILRAKPDSKHETKARMMKKRKEISLKRGKSCGAIWLNWRRLKRSTRDLSRFWEDTRRNWNRVRELAFTGTEYKS